MTVACWGHSLNAVFSASDGSVGVYFFVSEIVLDNSPFVIFGVSEQCRAL